MNDIDDKLWEIFINDSKRKGLHDDSYENYVVTPDVIIPQIKQAFEAAGYLYVPKGVTIELRLTGQEWYDRFEKEAEEVEARGSYSDDEAWAMYRELVQAAKKAAGLDRE